MNRTPGDETTGPATLGALFRRLASESSTRTLESDAALFRQGDTVRNMFLVERGRLRLQRHTVEGVRLTLQTARAGDLLAEASLFAERYHCDAVADGPGTVRVVARRTILDALQTRPDLARSVMSALAGQVIDLRTRLELRNIRSARERVWHHLSLMADGRRHVRISGTLKDMAEALGLSPEALYRTLAGLQRDGVIVRQAGMIRIMPGDGPDMRHRSS